MTTKLLKRSKPLKLKKNYAPHKLSRLVVYSKYTISQPISRVLVRARRRMRANIDYAATT